MGTIIQPQVQGLKLSWQKNTKIVDMDIVYISVTGK